jgi:hypothetical protein
VYRYRTIRDTLNIRDTVQVRVFVERSDSVVRACTELQNACQQYRVRAESVIADLHVENDALRAEVKAIHGSRIVNVWNKIKLPLAFTAGVYAGSRIVR